MRRISVSYYLIAIVLAGGMLVSYWAYSRYFQSPDKAYLKFQADRNDIEEVVKVRGEVVSLQEFDLEFPFSGTIEEIFVEEGKNVETGDRLMKLETTELELQAREIQGQISQAVSNVRSAEARLAQANADVAAAKGVLNQYESRVATEKKRLEELKSGPKPEEIQLAETAVKNADIQLQDARNDLTNTEEQNAENLDTILQTATDLLSSTLVDVDSLLTRDLEQVIYMSRYPSSRTCESSILLPEKESSIEDECVRTLQSLESLKSATSPELEATSIKLQLTEQRIFLNSFRSYLSNLLTGINTTNSASSTAKSTVVSVQTQGEALISKITSQIESIDKQIVANQSALDLAKSAVNQAENALATAEDQLKLTRAGATPQQISVQESEISSAESQLETQKAQIQKAEAQVQVAQADVNNSQANVAVIQARLSQTREKIEQATLHSPADARIASIALEAQEVFRPGTPVISLSSSAHKVEADISELDIGRIDNATNPQIRIELDPFPGKQFTGEVISIDPKEILKEGDRFYRLNASIEANGSQLRSGMSADLWIVISSKQDVITVPAFSVIEQDGQEFVEILKIKNDKEITERVLVETGITDGEMIEISSGLEPGQTVVVSAD